MSGLRIFRAIKLQTACIYTGSVTFRNKDGKSGPDLSNFIKSVSKPKELSKDDELVNAADAVSKVLGGEQVKSDLLKKLMNLDSETKAAAKTGLVDTLSSMTIESAQKTADLQIDRFKKYRDQFASEESHAVVDKVQTDREHVPKTSSLQRPDQKSRPVHEARVQQEMVDRENLARMKESLTETYPEINLLEGPRLNIFESENLPKQSNSSMQFWEKLEKRHLEWLTAEAPRNAFEEMIRWTEQGRMFPYPIDNEFGFFEKHIGFHEHVFLDHLAREGFPKTGALRRFIDLVAVGLSKNPYMTIEKKREHIEWFRDYFKDRHEEIEKLRQADVEERALRKMKNK